MFVDVIVGRRRGGVRTGEQRVPRCLDLVAVWPYLRRERKKNAYTHSPPLSLVIAAAAVVFLAAVCCGCSLQAAPVKLLSCLLFLRCSRSKDMIELRVVLKPTKARTIHRMELKNKHLEKDYVDKKHKNPAVLFP